MTLQEFIDNEVRPDVDDLGKLKYSDYGIANDANTVIMITNQMLTKYDSEVIDSTVEITLTSGTATLPDNFMSVMYATDSAGNELVPLQDYIIIADKIYSTSYNTILMQYKPYISTLKLTDVIPLPAWLIGFIRQFVVMLTKKTQDEQQLYSMIEDGVKYIVSKREVAYIYRDPPFFV